MRFIEVIYGFEPPRIGVASTETSPLRERIAEGFAVTALFGEGGESAVMAKTERGTANVAMFAGRSFAGSKSILDLSMLANSFAFQSVR